MGFTGIEPPSVGRCRRGRSYPLLERCPPVAGGRLATTIARVEIAPVTPDRWRDFVDLFSRRGPRGGVGPIHCSCMWWRKRGRSHERNREAMEVIVRGGGEPGLLAY